MSSSTSSSPDSLFSELSEAPNSPEQVSCPAASRRCPPIPGLYVFPSLIPESISQRALQAIGDDDLFHGGVRDQVMLFEPPPSQTARKPLPSYMTSLLSSIRNLISDSIPPKVGSVVFKQDLARQVIVNLYPPGQGISSHIDLPNRYADGIIGCSLIGGCVMSFSRPVPDSASELGVYRVYLPPRSIYILSGAARWEWAHGIAGTLEDVVEREDGEGEDTLLRDLRVSVTFRWMKDGADVLS
ncbi:hypothetical protein L198_05230 [Cryptococcus wingfieldii CBS 7118]|uniref:Fe2OG dioxygenase domain-containing protein n=1 Tax=Cryptococcus wingfieldii CBS 7118 TaxID=1295528 RepID=A0A1E3J334_9TREE|nr:hypothetical protein L198_05230 [Cryptococcus wingfieldii CBS 7118]ODN94371.1 hypothetical protein L198_05230 [Cryptococcus wingfieldii CBS 7118]